MIPAPGQIKMDEKRYCECQREKWIEHEGMCNRCGACCGIKDGDPCRHLIADADGRWACDIYGERFGSRTTVRGSRISCVPIRNMLSKTWLGRTDCAYVRALKIR